MGREEGGEKGGGGELVVVEGEAPPWQARSEAAPPPWPSLHPNAVCGRQQLHAGSAADRKPTGVVGGAPNGRRRGPPRVRSSKQNPECSFLRYHASTCILPEGGGDRPRSPFPVAAGGREEGGATRPRTERRATPAGALPRATVLGGEGGGKHSVLPHATQQLEKKQHMQTR